jgi:hypothetical protein
MKASTWVVLGVIGVGIYLIATSIATKISFVLQNVGIGVNGILTELQVSLLVTSSAPAAITLTNFTLTAIYNGAVIGTGLISGTINPGQSIISGNINLSDLTIISDITSAIANGVSSVTVTIQGAGKADNVPLTFTQNFTFPM